MKLTSFVAVITVAWIATLEGPAGACGNSYYHEVEPRVRQLVSAENLLLANRLERAAVLALELFPKTRQNPSPKDELELRAQRVLAVVAVRSGAWPIAGKLTVKDAAERQANVTWGTNVLRARATRKSGDPVAETELGEAEALATATRATASARLERLAGKDLITNPYAWATLAGLRDGQGDGVGRDRALAKCRGLANDKRICVVTAPPPAPPPNKKEKA